MNIFLNCYQQLLLLTTTNKTNFDKNIEQFFKFNTFYFNHKKLKFDLFKKTQSFSSIVIIIRLLINSIKTKYYTYLFLC